MSQSHPSRDLLEEFMRGSLTSERALSVLDHLLSDCSECRRMTGQWWDGVEEGVHLELDRPGLQQRQAAALYQDSIDRGIKLVEECLSEPSEERSSAESLCNELLAQPHGKRRGLILATGKYRSWGVCEVLLERGFAAKSDSPEEAVEIGRVAVVAAENLDPASYSARSRGTMLGRAWAYLGNAERILSDFRAADEALRKADELLNDASGDPLDDALRLRFRARLLRDLGEPGPAERLQDQAIRICKDCGEDTQAALVLISKANSVSDSGHPEEALSLYREASKTFEASGDTIQIARLQHNIAECLCDLERHEEALVMLKRSRNALRDSASELSRLRMRWLEGKILVGLSKLPEAETALMAARDGFIEEGVGYDAAQVSLELAALFAAEGRIAELKNVAEQMYPIFQSRDVHREAVAALTIFKQATEAENVSVALVERLANFLNQARSDTKLRFEP